MKALLLAAALLPIGAHAVCPDGAAPDAALGFCVKGVDAYGPFPKAMTDACVAAGAGSSCTATLNVGVDGVTLALQRWSRSFALSLRGTAPCPKGTAPSAAHDGLCLETLGTTKNLYAVWSAPQAAKCRYLGNGTACLSNRWAPGVYLDVRNAPPKIAWSAPASLNSALPLGLQAYRGSGSLGGTTVQALLMRWEPVNAPQLMFDVLSAQPSGALTPQQFSQQSGPRRWAVMNGGYFSDSPATSASLLVQGASLVEAGITGLVRSGQTYHPTRAAFGETASGFEAVWTYPTASGLVAYPQPAPNDSSRPPQPEPTLAWPSGGALWAPLRAVGGGPMLVRGGAAQVTSTAELFDAASGVAPASPAPRSAIGRTASGALLMLVVDGRSEFSGGATLADLATLLRSLGASEAINLDGGGSSALVVNGALATTPSDPGGQRAVHSVVVIRER